MAAKALSQFFLRRSYNPEKLMSDLGTIFIAILQELTTILEVRISQASLKQPQSVGEFERANGALKRFLRLITNDSWYNRLV